MVSMMPSREQILRASNNFWNAMYYDCFVDNENYQISYVESADRYYYNCAHVVTRYDKLTLSEIENWFKQKQTHSAVYLEPESESGLKNVLVKREYKESLSDLEFWYYIDLHDIQLRRNFLRFSKNVVKCLEITPENTKMFSEFLSINASVNAIPNALVEKFANNAIKKCNKLAKVHYFLGFVDKKPVSTLALGICENMIFLAEGATLPNYRRKGLLTNLINTSIKNCVPKGVRYAFANCDREAFSNQMFLKMGWQRLFERRLYYKKFENHLHYRSQSGNC